MADVFISYSRRDGAFVRELHGFLTGAGRDVWVDWQDIPPGSKWEQDLYDSIDAAESFVFVTSPDSLASEYCAAELRHAGERGKRIVPIAIDGASPGDAPVELRELNWIWCREDDDRDAAFAALTTALDTDLEWSRAHTRLLVRAVEWDARHDGSMLLRGKDLAEAERVLAANAGKEPRPTELQERYLHESRRSARRRQRALLGGVTIALAASIVLGLLALLQRNDARSATRKATSAALAAAANDRVDTRPDQALLLALAAYASSPSADARNAGVMALEKARQLGVIAFVHGDSQVRDVAFAPDGRTLAVGSADGAVRLWDIRARKEVATLAEAGSPIVNLGFARKGSLVGAGSEDGAVRLWNVRSGDLAAPVLRAARRILASAVSADGQKAAAVDKFGRVWLWDVGSGKPRRLEAGLGTKADLTFSPDGQTLAAATTHESGNFMEGDVQLFHLASGKRQSLSDVSGDYNPVTAVAFSRDGRSLATGGYVDDFERSHGELRVWNVRRLDRGPSSALQQGPFVVTVAFSRDGRTIVAGGDDGSIRRARAAAGGWKWLDSRLSVPGSVTSLAFSSDGRTVAAAPEGAATVRVSSVDGPSPFGRVIGRKKDITGADVAFSPDGRTVAAAEGEKGVLVVPLDGAKPHWLEPPARGAWVDGVAFDPDGHVVASVLADDGSSQRWNLRTGARVSSSSTLVDPAEEGLGAFGKRSGVNDVLIAAVAADGHTFAIGDHDGRVWLWDSRQQQAARPLGGDAATGQGLGSVDAVEFSPDGRTLAVAQTSGSPIQLWDVRGQRALGGPLPRSGDDSALAFSPDGRVLASSDGYVVRLWEGILWRDLADLRAQVCTLVAGDLTREEWASIAPGIAYREVCG